MRLRITRRDVSASDRAAILSDGLLVRHNNYLIGLMGLVDWRLSKSHHRLKKRRRWLRAGEVEDLRRCFTKDGV